MAANGTGDDGATAEAGVARAAAGAHEITLDVEAIRLDVRLGCTAAERAVPQGIEVKVTIRFPLLPDACWSDRLEDTVCYAELAALARAHCAEREFRLVERLALELYGLVHERLPRGARLALAVTKLAPPVAEIQRGVRFTIADR